MGSVDSAPDSALQLQLTDDIKRHKTGESWARMVPSKVPHLGIGDYNPAEGKSSLPASPRRAAPAAEDAKALQRNVELSQQNRALQAKLTALEVQRWLTSILADRRQVELAAAKQDLGESRRPKADADQTKPLLARIAELTAANRRALEEYKTKEVAGAGF